MANTYTKVNIHVVFAVQHRESLITKKYSEELYKYIAGILKNIKQYPLAVNGYKDHVHVFFEQHPTIALSDIVKTVKSNSSKWINENRFVNGKFSWQKGYGAFSYSYSQRNNVIQYIVNQESHHKSKSFKEEYLLLLEKFKISYDENYVFEFFD